MLTPTRIYEYAFAPLRRLAEAPLHGAAHITGGGLLDNPQRALGETLAVELDLSQVPCPPILAAIAAQGVAPRELLRTFNCGVGMILYLGRVVPRGAGDPQVRVRGGAWLGHATAVSDA
jgi:phosphoribosylformylglycinamidine cyclo-ligase